MAESGSSAPRSVASRPDNAASTSEAGHSFAHHRPLGYSARFAISEERLPPGWRQEKKGPKYTVWYDDKGKRYKSSIEVVKALNLRGLLCGVSDTETETGGETSEYEPSPIKMSRTDGP